MLLTFFRYSAYFICDFLVIIYYFLFSIFLLLPPYFYRSFPSGEMELPFRIDFMVLFYNNLISKNTVSLILGRDCSRKFSMLVLKLSTTFLIS